MEPGREHMSASPKAPGGHRKGHVASIRRTSGRQWLGCGSSFGQIIKKPVTDIYGVSVTEGRPCTVTPFNCPSSPPSTGPRGRASAEERTEARGGSEADQPHAPPACLNPAPPFLGLGGGRPVSTPSALAIWSRLSVRCPAPL